MTELVPAVPFQLSPMLFYTLAAAVVVAVGAFLLLLLDGAYLVALLPFLLREARREGGRAAALLTAVLTIPLFPASHGAAQQGAAGVPTIEPRHTRIFGTDSMEMFDAVLSPDGRWVAFVRAEGPNAFNLWMVATAGGEPVRLTSGRHSDDRPVWFPTGDRLLFRSDRTRSLMTIPIDPTTGKPGGPPRQVSLEFPNFSHTLSFDGSHIAYVAVDGGTQRIVVIPATGGASRTVVEHDESLRALGNLCWTPDDWIYYTARTPGDVQRKLYRVPAAGGVPQELSTPTGLPSAPAYTRISADGRLMLARLNQGPGQEPAFQLAAIHDGRLLAQFTLPRQFLPPSAFTPDGRGIIGIQSNVVAPIRVVPVAGGPTRQLTDAREYDWPIGWSADGTRVLVQTQADGRQAILAVPLAGGPATQWTIPADARAPIRLSLDGRFLLYGVGDDPASRALRVRRLADGETRDARQPPHYPLQGLGPVGAGGAFGVSHDGFLTSARSGDQLEIWLTPAEGPSRLIRSFPFSLAGRTAFGVHRDRVAYRERRGDSTALFVVEGRDGAPRLLTTVIGDANEPTWSHDGRWIAYDYYPPGNNPKYGVLVIGLGPDGSVTTPPRVITAGPMWGWQIEWLPTNDAFTVFGMTGAASETHVYLVSLRQGEAPIVVTRDDPSVRWGYDLSPDGRHVAYPAEIPRGSSIWRVDLSEVLAPGG